MLEIDSVEGDGTIVANKVYPCGFDFGNAEICVVLLDGRKTLTKSVPTAFAKVDSTQLNNLGVDIADALVIRGEQENVEWGIGEVALAQSNDTWNGRGDLLRYSSKHALRALLRITASMIPDKEYTLIVSSGLPAEIYQHHTDIKDIKKGIKRALAGDHVFTTDNGETMRTCHVEYALTLMEGAGALQLYARKDNTSPQGGAVIDIGGRTTDLCVMRNGVPVAEFCKGKPIGVATAEQILRSAFEKKYKFPLTDLEARNIMFAYANTAKAKKKPYTEISNRGNKITASELEQLADEAVQETTQEIVSFVAATWRESDRSSALAVRFDPCLIIGGGAYYFFEALHARIQHLQKPEDPLFANAAGFAKASEARYLQKRAEAKKKQDAEQAAAIATEIERAKAAAEEAVIEPSAVTAEAADPS
jgi:plasmid segregation protein ParM